jgi:hypothetical protein
MKTLLLFFLAVAIVMHAQSTNQTVVVRGKTVTVGEVERMVREHATKTKITFDFDHSSRTFSTVTNPASVFAAHLIFFRTNGTGRYLQASVTRDGRVSAMESWICGGVQ